MRNVNNKGFTLLELIIAIAILSVVIFVGYGVINGSNKTTSSQKYISKSQMSTNLINKYVTKDIEILEADKDIVPKNNNVEIDLDNSLYRQSYYYTIDTVNHSEGKSVVDKVEYEIKHEGKIEKNKLRGKYSVNRKSKQENDVVVSDLELVNNQNTLYYKDNNVDIKTFIEENVKPFNIDKYNSDINLYSVGIYYDSDSKDKEYSFDVSPRINIAEVEGEPQPPEEPQPPVKPEEDPDFEGNSAYIRFKYKDGYAWSDAGPKGNSNNNSIGKKYNPITSTQKIYALIESGSSNGKVTTSMDEGKSNASAQNNAEFPKENYNQIKLSLYGNANVEDLTITVRYKGNGGYYTPIKNKKIDQTQIIKIDSTRNGFGQESIVIDGKMRLNLNSDYEDIIINLGHSKE
ncbi:MAG: prepilin-type N-terminal cleavage/methylation domain-containing protein [Peptostreptococcaceae bacterium]